MASHSRKPADLPELIQSVRAGEEPAQERLYKWCQRQFGGHVVNFLLDRGCSKAALHGPEVAGSALGKIFLKIDTLKDDEKFLTWAYTIVENEACSHLKKCIPRQKVEAPWDALSPKRPDDPRGKREAYEQPSIASGDEVLVAALMIPRVRELAAEYDEKLPDILRRHFEDDESLHEIAEAVGLSFDQTRDIYYRGLKVLKKMLTATREEVEAMVAKRRRLKNKKLDIAS